MASAIKKFFQKRKLDVKFKKAGEGHRLADDRPPTSRSPQQQASPRASQQGASGGSGHPAYQRSSSHESQRAAEAALARSQGQAKKTPDATMAAKARMRKEMELEKKKEQEAITLAEKYREREEEVRDAAPMTTVLYTCPEISPAVLPKDEMEAHIHEFLLGQLAEEPEMASALMIHTLNKDRDQVKTCVETLCKYLDNIINNPSEEKFRKIRRSNKAFSERIAALQGTEEFLQAAGFEVKMLPFEDHEEQFFVMDETMAKDVERLQNLKAVLETAEPIKPQLDRAMKVFYPTKSAANFTIPQEFYAISPAELKKEQQRKQEAVETLGMLRTKAMREREERRELLRYKFTLIRVRFPDGILLQGTFKATEKLSVLKEYMREHLTNDWIPFQLCTQIGTKLDDDNKMLAEYGLTPAAVVNFEWDKAVMKDVTAQQGSSQKTSPLKPDVLAQIQEL